MHPVAALFGRSAWASAELVRHCADLDLALLDRDVPGTRGSIRTTLTHLTGSEQAYLARLTGQQASDPIRRGQRRDPADLEPMLGELAGRWRTLLEGPSPPGDTWVPLVQCLHHGDEHRTQVLSALGGAGAAEPRLDPRAFAEQAADGGRTPAPAPWTDALLPRCFAFSAWATLAWLDHCLRLGEPALRAQAPGTYGPVHETLTHLAGADAAFLGMLTGAPADSLQGAADLDDLRRCVERCREGWLGHLAASPDPERPVEAPGRRVPAWRLILAAIAHANEHRTHVGTALGANGLPVPDADVWAYAEHLGTRTA